MDWQLLLHGLPVRVAKFFESLAHRVREDQLVLDLVNIPQREALRGKVVRLCW